MHAQSLLLSIRDVEQSLDDVLTNHRLTDATATTTQIAAIRSTLQDVATQLRGVTPAPGWKTSGEAGQDASVRTTFVRMYEGASTVDEVESAIDEGLPSLDVLVASGRVVTVDDHVLVPLSGPVAADNWRVLVDVLEDRLETVRSKIRKIKARLRADGLASESRLLDRWEAIEDRIGALVELLVRVSAHTNYIRQKAATKSLRIETLVNEMEALLQQ